MPSPLPGSTEAAALPDWLLEIMLFFGGFSQTSLKDDLLPRKKLVFSIKKEVKL